MRRSSTARACLPRFVAGNSPTSGCPRRQGAGSLAWTGSTRPEPPSGTKSRPGRRRPGGGARGAYGRTCRRWLVELKTRPRPGHPSPLLADTGPPQNLTLDRRGSILAKSAPGHVSDTRAPSMRPSFGLSSSATRASATRASSGMSATSTSRSVRRTSGASPSGTGQSAAWSAPGEGSKSWPASSTTLPIFSSSASPPS
jgi:hypothetical protein